MTSGVTSDSGERAGAAPGKAWLLRVPEGTEEALAKKFLGLTFLERRLREAKVRGISRAFVLVPGGMALSSAETAASPRSAAVTVMRASEWTGRADLDVFEVDVFALVSGDAPYSTDFAVDPAGSWRPAERWMEQKIIDGCNAGWVAKRLNKPLSFAMSRRLANTRVSPNQISMFNLLIGIACAVAVATPGYWPVVLGGFLFQMASVLDGVDGEVAKFRLESSKFGAWLDTAVDNGTLLLFLGGVGVNLFRVSSMSSMTILTVTSTMFGAVLLYLGLQLRFCVRHLKNASLAVWTPLFVDKLPRRDWAVKFVRAAKYATKKDFFSMFFFAMTLTGRLEVLLFLITAAVLVALVCSLYLNTRYLGLLYDKS